ncbi:MAG: hypothetical protein H7061_09350 [Bdellovibrionaceae bacterium]|nr:hypothetical protein [Bdellovibrio sp.]
MSQTVVSPQFEFIQFTLFKLQSLVTQSQFLQNEIAQSIEEYYIVIRYHYLLNRVEDLKKYLTSNPHYQNHAFNRVACLMLNVMRVEALSPTQLQDHFFFFSALETSVAKAEGLLYLALTLDNPRKAELAASTFQMAAAQFKLLGFKTKYFSCEVAALSQQEEKSSLEEIVVKYECIYRESINLKESYSSGIIQYNIAERYFVNKKFEMAKRHLAIASQHASRTEIPRTYFYIQILKCRVAQELECLYEVSSELEECLICSYKEIQKEAQMLIDQRNNQHNPVKLELNQIIFKYDLTPNEIKLLRCLLSGEIEISAAGEKLFGYLPDEKSLNNRINNLISRIKKKTNLQIKKSYNRIRMA